MVKVLFAYLLYRDVFKHRRYSRSGKLYLLFFFYPYKTQNNFCLWLKIEIFQLGSAVGVAINWVADR